MRRHEPLTADQLRELEALDRALAAEPVESELRELERLVHDIRAGAPEMSPAFAARLEHEVSEGFPARRQPPGQLRRLARPWVLLPALGSLAAVLVALVVLLGGRDDTITTFEGPATVAVPDSAREEAARDRASGAGSADPTARDRAATAPAPAQAPTGGAAGTGTATAPQARARKVERSAVLVLQTADGDFTAATDDVMATAARFGGIVASFQIDSSDAGGSEAAFDLRIPTARLDRALAALSRLGHVTERSQSLQDITASFGAARERLADARAERRGLLRALARAATQRRIDSLRARLRDVGRRIRTQERRLAALGRRADLARVDLTVRDGGTRDGTGGGGPWTPGDAARDALRVLEVLAGIALVGLAVLVPLGVLGLAVALGVRLGRRRRREAALDPA